MYLMYVDESGDTGLINSPTRYFVLCGLVIHELCWEPCLEAIIDFRRAVRNRYGLKLREEIHSAQMLVTPGALSRINKGDRLAILRQFADKLASMPDLRVISVVVDKNGRSTGYDVFEKAWEALIQRFENTIRRHNFPGPSDPDGRGLLFPDNTDNKKLSKLLRRMRRYNPVPHDMMYTPGYRDMTLTRVIEDPNFRDSRHSYFVQAADLIAFLLYQREEPSRYVRRKGAHNYFLRLQPILCTQASRYNHLGIVNL